MLTGTNNGKVILAAAGPGDPELITAKAIRYLQQAEVVLTDRLVSDDIIRWYVNPAAELVYVGKQCRRGASTPQQSINELLVHHAQRGKLVVRLKGGDVSIFSNVLDELMVLKANNIAYEIVPGVTAALGAAAYAGIPLTARGYTTSVRFLTSYQSDVVSEAYWKELAHTSDTLVFYMSAETIEGVVANLLKYGIANNVHIAVVEQATTPLQNVYTCNIHEYATKLKGQALVSPSLVIIGTVVALHEQFGWVANSNSKEYYFKPVASLQHSNNAYNSAAHVSRA
ncbi:uroporphyrin-III C-methyltransferase / precorrin-2 dehydrogenase / sirohydrochlorin ferrochelatase/uroporphyrin-III C-methyltransferase [Filimonas lacunae]|uniref:uroporphyrinogen-III C-methyltransferase n=1 Tax=Filimonas lacunae TaxID=477680 RepID=A0A173MN28_9BACT|nr:uroporphyrinogen-III C-methyltransferase [Filimonas lacunae]BAV08801.1 siroheme synthase [Filimonas lacunae]SIS61960.1 uroporphyrin-III C-methyltransferase / precorrin-2 dehydrogenase / sirohydrochlorin ferrochelatase/uroporphyrin-III C-methyltransferase [Filimonas lacunae]